MKRKKGWSSTSTISTKGMTVKEVMDAMFTTPISDINYIIVDDLYADRDLKDPQKTKDINRWFYERVYERDFVQRARNAGAI